ncbi:MAG: STAS domain-containing protein [Actinomycetia bacterium]|nr:STAS domain-containing protein [Actinomycetes bacterium]
MELGLSQREVGSITVVAVSGELDVFTAPQLESALNDLVTAGRVEIVVDLSGVSFLDSTGLGAMVKALKWVKEQSGSLTVVAADERIVKVFKITGLDDVMSLQAELDPALAGS